MDNHANLCLIRLRTLVALLVSIAAGAVITSDQAAASRKNAPVEITIVTMNQAALLSTKKLNLNIKTRIPVTVRVWASPRNRSNHRPARLVRFKEAGTKRVSFYLGGLDRARLSTCGAKTVKVAARYRRGSKPRKATAKKTLAHSSKECPPTFKPPVASDDLAATDEASAALIPVLANDSDPDGRPLTIVSVDDSGTTGTATLVGQRIHYDPDGQLEALAEGQTGSDTFTYTVENDKGKRDTARVAVDIEGIDDPSSLSMTPALYPEYSPEISDYVTRCGGSPVQIDVEAGPGNTIDIDGQGPATGNFSTEVELSANQGFTFVRGAGSQEATHHVRCLPADFPEWTFEKFSPTEQQWYMVTREAYSIMFDGDGVPVWWFNDPTLPGDFKYLGDGTLAWATGGTNDDTRYEIRAFDATLLNTLRTTGNELDAHDLQLLPNGNYMVMTYMPRATTTDISAYGGPTDATILDAELQEIEPDGTLVWSWNSGGHVGFDETGHWWGDFVLNVGTTSGTYDVVHMNSAQVVEDSVVVSMRHTDAIYKIDLSTGDIVWKLGGTSTPESLTVLGDPFGANPLGGQHYARILADGTLTAFDNGMLKGRQPRAVQYSIDEESGTATLLESVVDPDVPAAICCGSARRSETGSWLMAWGGPGTTEYPVTEFAADGSRTFRLGFLPAGAFTYRVHSVPRGVIAATELRSGMDRQFPR